MNDHNTKQSRWNKTRAVMSLSRIPYLEWLEGNSGASREDVDRASVTDSDEDAYLELPNNSIASSFSSLSYVPIRRSTKPVAGLGSNESGEVEAEVGPPDSGTREGTGIGSEGLPLDEPDGLLKTTGAFEVYSHKRIAQVCIAVLSCFLSGGIIFGYAAIKPILVKESVYRDLCSQEELHQGVSVCYGQDIRYASLQPLINRANSLLQSEHNVHHSSRRNKPLGTPNRHNPRHLWPTSMRAYQQQPPNHRLSTSGICQIHTLRRIYCRIPIPSPCRTIHLHPLIPPLKHISRALGINSHYADRGVRCVYCGLHGIQLD